MYGYELERLGILKGNSKNHSNKEITSTKSS